MTNDQLEEWVSEYGKAWTSRDPDAAARLFAKDAVYFETPFGPPAKGSSQIAEYWAAATRSQSNIAFSSQIVCLVDHVGVVRWQASFKRASAEKRVRLDGVFLLDFDEKGLCKSLREWWHREES